MHLAEKDEMIHNAVENVRSIYKGQHTKYDYTQLLYKNTKELDIAS